MNTKIRFILIGVLATFFLFNSCENNEPADPTISYEASVKWGQMTLKTMTKLVKNSPTYGSRALGYMGLTMYESVVQGSSKHRSIIPQLTTNLILPTVDPTKKTNWVLAMNASQARMLKNLFPYLDESRLILIDSLEEAIKNQFSAGYSKKENENSIAFGQAMAESIFEWSKEDGGHAFYNFNFDPSYKFPQNPGNWIPATKSQVVSSYPLHPFWEKNRTFVPANSSLAVPSMIPYSQSPTSPYYKMMEDVYKKNKILTQEEKDIAAWWADDPTETFSPPGHSYSLANIIVSKEKPDLFKAAESYARVGMAVGDAFINCWKAKYKFFAERPSTFVRIFIDKSWEQFWPEPPFPSFYSGHAVQSSAAATVLEDLYGKTYKVVDNTHEGRVDAEKRGVFYKTRTYNTIWETALEAAQSRFLGGIHSTQDNEIGLNEGKKIGSNVNALKWAK